MPHQHNIAWLLCVRGDESMDELSLFGIIWMEVMGKNYYDGQNLKWLATIINQLSDISRPASFP